MITNIKLGEIRDYIHYPCPKPIMNRTLDLVLQIRPTLFVPSFSTKQSRSVIEIEC